MNERAPSVKCANMDWLGHPDCLYCIVRYNAVLAELDLASYETLLRSISKKHLPSKSYLYLQNQSASDLFVIRSGIIKLEEMKADGDVRIVRLLQSGDVAGLEACVDNGIGYNQSAVVLHGADVCKIPYRFFDKLAMGNICFAKNIMKTWYKQLSVSNRVIIEFSTGTVRDRVARVLLFLAEASRQRHSAEIEMLSIEDISALTSVASESISRVMAGFKRDGLLVKSGPNRMKYKWSGLNALVNH